MKERICERLVRLRKHLGLSQVEVSAATGIARTFLSKMEKGDTNGTWDGMCALSDLYNVSLDYIRFGDPTVSNQTK